LGKNVGCLVSKLKKRDESRNKPCGENRGGKRRENGGDRKVFSPATMNEGPSRHQGKTAGEKHAGSRKEN